MYAVPFFAACENFVKISIRTVEDHFVQGVGYNVDVDVADAFLFMENVEWTKNEAINLKPNFFGKFEKREDSGPIESRQCNVVKIIATQPYL
jgi:hypothetical protein